MSRIKLDWTEQSADVEQRLTFVGGKKEICCNPSICLLRISNVVGCQVDNKEPHKVGSKHTLRSLSPLRFLLWGFSGRRWRVWQNNEERRERDFFLVFPFSFSNSKLKKWKNWALYNSNVWNHLLDTHSNWKLCILRGILLQHPPDHNSKGRLCLRSTHLLANTKTHGEVFTV